MKSIDMHSTGAHTDNSRARWLPQRRLTKENIDPLASPATEVPAAIRGMKGIRWAAILAVSILPSACGGPSSPETVVVRAARAPAEPAGLGQAMPEPVGLYTDPASVQDVKPPLPPVVSEQAAAAASKVADKAKKEERLDTTKRIGSDFLTPAPEAIKARHVADEAEASAVKAHTRPVDSVKGTSKERADKREFALFTGGPRPTNADGSAGTHAFENQPVWVITYTDVVMTPIGQPSPAPVMPSSDGPARLVTAPPVPATVTPSRITGTVTVIVDDLTGGSLMEISEGRAAP